VRYVDLSSIHVPSPGARPPASWGNGIASNLRFLGSAASAEVLTSQTRTLTIYGDMTTRGPIVTVDTGERAVVLMSAQMGGTVDAIAACAVTGASDIPAADDTSLYMPPGAGGTLMSMVLFDTLTPGMNIFTMRYRITSGTGTFLRRRMLVIPLAA